MSKADYISLINTKLPDGTQLPSSQHRETMHTDPNSIIELVYGGVVNETQAAQSIFTSANPDITYNINVYKVGRSITMGGVIKNAGASITSPSLLISDVNYECLNGFDFIGVGFIEDAFGYENISLEVSNSASSTLLFANSIQPGEIVKFTVTYPSNL